MHNQRPRFHDVIGDVRAGLEASIEIGRGATWPQAAIADPGFSFGWTVGRI
jgi:hypothetical protein